MPTRKLPLLSAPLTPCPCLPELHVMRAKRSLRRAADLLSVAGVPVAEATKVLAREPNSPVTQAIKLWGDDEEPFKNLITSSAPAAREWRRTMARIIAHLKSDDSGRPVFRGWYFGSSAQRTEFMAPILKQGFFVNPRIGMSASRSRRVSTSAAFLNRQGVIWEIRAPRTARDFAPIFDAIGAKYPEQREVVFPRHSRFVLIEAPRKLTLLRGGQKIRVPYLVFEEA